MLGRSLLVGLILPLLWGCGRNAPGAADADGVIALSGSASGVVVNGEAVPQALIDAYARKRGWNLTDPGQLGQVKEKTVELLAMAQAAQAQGLLDDPAMQADLALERLNQIAGRFLERQQAANPPSDEALREEFEREQALVGNAEYRVGHILFDQQAQATAAMAEAAHEDFDALMARYQDQPGVRDARELGWVKRNQLPEALREPLAALAPGAVASQVLQSEFGWHVLKLYESREFKGPEYEQIKDGIRKALQRKQSADFAQSVREKATVEGL